MKINPIGPPIVSRTQPPDGRAVENQPPEKPSPASALPSSKAVAIGSGTLSSPLSAETQKHLTFATQKVIPRDEDAHKIPPAQRARAALAANSDLGDRPFGSLVSLIARGEPLVASNSSSQSVEETPPNSVSEPTNLPVDNPTIEDQTPTGLNLVIEGLTNSPAIDQLTG